MIPSKKMIHVITNDVTKQFVADAIAAYKATPIMSETCEEFKIIYPKLDAAVINLGMVNIAKQKVIHKACYEANLHKLPLVIDLVGIHFSDHRKTFALELLRQYAFTVIKGNSSEISALISDDPCLSFDAIGPIGYDSIAAVSKHYPDALIVATGATDYVAKAGWVNEVTGGSILMPCVSGTGCVLSGLMGACLGALTDEAHSYDAILNLCKTYKLASEKAEVSSRSKLGQFKIDLISAIYEMEAYHET